MTTPDATPQYTPDQQELNDNWFPTTKESRAANRAAMARFKEIDFELNTGSPPIATDKAKPEPAPPKPAPPKPVAPPPTGPVILGRHERQPSVIDGPIEAAAVAIPDYIDQGGLTAWDDGLRSWRSDGLSRPLETGAISIKKSSRPKTTKAKAPAKRKPKTKAHPYLNKSEIRGR